MVGGADKFENDYIQCESKKSRLRTCGIFSKMVGNFSTKFHAHIMHAYYAFLSTIDCEFLFNYLQL